MMKKKRLSIGQMAKLNHTTVATLRLYDKMGIMKPAYVDPETNYRYYDFSQCARLRAIHFNRILGLNLKEIETFMNSGDYEAIENLYGRKQEEIEHEIEFLNRKRAALEHIRDHIRHYHSLPPVGTTTLEYVETAYAYTMPASVNYFDGDTEDYERGISELSNAMINDGYTFESFYYTGIMMSESDFRNEIYRADSIFMYVDKIYKDRPRVSVVESGMYACIYFDDFNKKLDYIEKLRDYCRKNNCTITGKLVCEKMSRLNTKYFSKMFRVRVPVTF